MQLKTIPQCFTNNMLFSSICQFLTIKQLLDLSTLNHLMRKVLEHYCNAIYKQLNLKPSTFKSSIHQMQFYFNRCLKIFKQDRHIDEMGIVTINHPFKFQTIKHFEVGTTYACYLTRDLKARIFRTSSLVKFYQQNSIHKKPLKITELPKYQMRNGIKDIKSKSQQCLLLKTNGEVIQLSTNKTQQHIITSQSIIDWSVRISIQSIINSFNYSIFFPQSYNDLKNIFSQVFGKNYTGEDKKEEDGSLYLIGKNMVTNKLFVIEVPCDQIIDSTVGNRQAYFISRKNQIFQADLQEKVDNQFLIYKAKIFQPLKGKTIVKIVNGYNFFIALQRNVELLQEWNTERVVQWLRDLGFEAYIKIARFQKLDGKKLKNIQKKYMHNVLGITTQNMQQKFMMSIQQNLYKKSKSDQLWGWGKNQSGQLGSYSANFVTKPQKIRLNLTQKDEQVIAIFCGWYQTFIRTQKGRIYCTVINTQKKRKGQHNEKQHQQKIQQKKQQQQYEYNVKQLKATKSDDEDSYEAQIDELQRKGNKKRSKQQQNQKKRKKTVQYEVSLKQKQKQKNKRKYQQQQNWYQLSIGKSFFVQAYKDNIFVIQCPHQPKQQPNINKKLRPAKAILDKILWSNLNKQQFKVGYIDKDMGLIEASALDMQKFDVKQNRVKYFKRNNIIVWDRDSKIDLI